MRSFWFALGCASVVVTSSAFAQTLEPLPPPPPPPPSTPAPPQPPPNDAAPSAEAPRPVAPAPPQRRQHAEPPSGYTTYRPAPQPYPPPPRRSHVRLYAPGEGEFGSVPTHAPKYSLWTGARLSYMGFGQSFYWNRAGRTETTGNFVGNGVAPEFDIGARISYRFIPFVFWEHGFLPAGHRFVGESASASTDYYGIGFRYLSGDVNSVAFLTDIAIGERVVSVTNNGETYKMRGIEFFKLGLGAEIRIQTLFTLSPVLSVSTGQFSDSDGTVRFSADGSKDGTPGPGQGSTIDDPRTYVVVSLGVGLHFDLFGK